MPRNLQRYSTGEQTQQARAAARVAHLAHGLQANQRRPVAIGGTGSVMTEASIWVGLLDLDDSEPVRAVSGPLGDRHDMARVLIRMHHAPIGYVLLPVAPADSLTARATSLAENAGRANTAA